MCPMYYWCVCVAFDPFDSDEVSATALHNLLCPVPSIFMVSLIVSPEFEQSQCTFDHAFVVTEGIDVLGLGVDQFPRVDQGSQLSAAALLRKPLPGAPHDSTGGCLRKIRSTLLFSFRRWLGPHRTHLSILSKSASPKRRLSIGHRLANTAPASRWYGRDRTPSACLCLLKNFAFIRDESTCEEVMRPLLEDVDQRQMFNSLEQQVKLRSPLRFPAWAPPPRVDLLFWFLTTKATEVVAWGFARAVLGVCTKLSLFRPRCSCDDSFQHTYVLLISDPWSEFLVGCRRPAFPSEH